MTQHYKRKFVHLAMIGFALFIGWIPPWAISAAAFTAFLFVYFVLPRIGGDELRSDRQQFRNIDLGLVLYPISLTLISLIFFRQQVFMAIAWGAMGFGDAFASIFGKIMKRYPIPWNPHKTIMGSLMFFVGGLGGTMGLLYLLPSSILLDLPIEKWFLIVYVTLFLSAIVETIPGLINDNFSVPIFAAVWAFIQYQLILHGAFFFPTNFIAGFTVVGLFVMLSWASGKIDVIGAMAGGVIASGLFLGGGFPLLGLLFVFFVMGTVASSWKKGEKKQEGLLQENEGKRSINNALANGGVAGLLGFLAWSFPTQAPLLQIMAAATLAAATSDTLASELGNVYGKRYLHVLTGQPEQRGRDGAISWEGTFAGFVGSVIIGLLFFMGTHATWIGMLGVVLAGVVGNYADSVLGATLQRSGLMDNDTVNFFNTILAALFAGGFYMLIN
ncbi:MAG: DUF92 domain-containing protein [Bacteroidota bacterium]